MLSFLSCTNSKRIKAKIAKKNNKLIFPYCCVCNYTELNITVDEVVWVTIKHQWHYRLTGFIPSGGHPHMPSLKALYQTERGWTPNQNHHCRAAEGDQIFSTEDLLIPFNY